MRPRAPSGPYARRWAWTGLLGLAVFLLVPGLAGAQEPPDTVAVDSTRLRIQQRLQGLARPPGVDSTYFLPDSLLPDSLRELREAQRQGRGALASRSTAARPPAAGDSIMAALLALPGYSATEYQGTGANFDATDRTLFLLGTQDRPARILSEGQELSADTVVYSEETGKVWTMGNEAVFQPPDQDAVTSRAIVFDLEEERGTALDARTKYSGGAEWIVNGNLTSVTDTASFGSGLSFTSCELEEPHYHFASNHVKIVRDKVMVAMPVKLYFADVPVAWLPFMAQSLARGRASGLLTPTFSVNDIVRQSQGYRRRVSNIGFYWAMSDYYDSTLYLDWWSGELVSLTGSLRYGWARQFLSGALNYRQFWRNSGSNEQAFDGNTNWQISERTNFRFRARYASSSSFVRRTSLDPMEVVQSIDSEGGLSHRFDFGNLSLSANRRQFLSEDRVETMLPNVSLSLSPQTFFQAAPSQARFYNNLTWSGSASFRRNVYDRVEQSDTAAFSPSLADQVKTNASFNTGLTLGNVSVSTGLTANESLVKGVPVGPEGGAIPEGELPTSFQDQARTDLAWNASLGYQLRLIGATTLTPSLSLSRQFLRDDADSLATSFLSAPTRISLGASLRTDLYGFFPGFGPFDAIRHKVSPGFNFSYSPKVSPTAVQEAVFGTREVGARRTLQISLNQTFEARRKETEAPDSLAGAQLPGETAAPPAEELGGLPGDTLGVGADTLATDSLGALPAGPAAQGQGGQKVTLLSLRTSAVTYDFEEASNKGSWLQGFTTTQLTNTIASDYLRGLNLTLTHDLFKDVADGTGAGSGTSSSRTFSPRLTQMNLSFSMDSNSLPFRLLGGLLGGGEEGGAAAVPASPPGEEEATSPFGETLTDESSVIPGGEVGRQTRRATTGGGVGGWRANLAYSLQRPRVGGGESLSNQMIQGSMTFNATEKWQVSWRTSYDVTAGTFNDHWVRLTRDLHRWQANFDFRQTATGNWSFRFEVSLLDNEDLHFDYQQRSVQDATGFRRF